MIVKYFRFVDNDIPSGYVGLAIAHNKIDLFWQIDELGDPFSCELMSVRSASICFKQEEIEGEDDAGDTINSELELSESFLYQDEYCWKKPNWNRSKLY